MKACLWALKKPVNKKRGRICKIGVKKDVESLNVKILDYEYNNWDVEQDRCWAQVSMWYFSF